MNNATDLTTNYDFNNNDLTFRVMHCKIKLSREEMCNALKSDFVFINGEYYETPTDQICFNLKNMKYDCLLDYELKQYVTK